MIDSAERSEISCSPDRPPKTTPTRILLTPQSPLGFALAQDSLESLSSFQVGPAFSLSLKFLYSTAKTYKASRAGVPARHLNASDRKEWREGTPALLTFH